MLKQRVYEIVEVARPGDHASRAFDVFLISLITLNVLALILSTVEDIHRLAPGLFHWFEVASLAFYTVEYLLRVWSCTADPRYASPINGRLRFIVSPISLVDLLVILPLFVVPFFHVYNVDLRFLRAFRLVARASRLTRYSVGLRNLGAAVGARKNELLTVVGVLAVLLVLASSLMFYVEQGAQPEEFSSIPAAMWWSVITLTTVGYGDVAPVTALGRLIAGVIAILGIGLFALPAGILGSSFLEQIERRRIPAVCPHCGREIN